MFYLQKQYCIKKWCLFTHKTHLHHAKTTYFPCKNFLKLIHCVMRGMPPALPLLVSSSYVLQRPPLKYKTILCTTQPPMSVASCIIIIQYLCIKLHIFIQSIYYPIFKKMATLTTIIIAGAAFLVQSLFWSKTAFFALLRRWVSWWRKRRRRLRRCCWQRRRSGLH